MEGRGVSKKKRREGMDYVAWGEGERVWLMKG